KEKIKSVVLKNQPDVYAAEKNTRLAHVLNKLGYATAEETSAVIPVGHRLFGDDLHKSERKRLRKCREHGLTFEVMPADQLSKIYGFLEVCRQEKGYSLSMSLPEMQALINVFPERILLTAVIDKHKLVAANISIRVYNHVLYNFYHDHASEYDLLSPVVLLNEGLYEFCQKEKIQLLDLGTSNVNGELNESLLNFKLNLGAKTSRKLTFTKTFV
ncbi:MAG TPA: GNAT family N-acetyltransferase, partial [Cyclobacteriaceae bacterium]|nr:GNAT family N-acetyltransferase [Cyclobacteriaceae bacterium]